MTPPDLDDPAQRAAYRRELGNVAKPLRYAGFGFVLLGAVLVAIRVHWAPALPKVIPFAVIAIGLINMLAGIVARVRYHLLRMRGD